MGGEREKSEEEERGKNQRRGWRGGPTSFEKATPPKFFFPSTANTLILQESSHLWSIADMPTKPDTPKVTNRYYQRVSCFLSSASVESEDGS